MAGQGTGRSAWRQRMLPASVATVAVLGVGWMIAVGTMVRSKPFSDQWAELAVFLVLIVMVELRPITFARSSGIHEIVVSTAFAFAAFLACGPLAAMALTGIASVVGDLVARKAPLKVVFNCTQFWVAWGVATVPFVAVAGSDAFLGSPSGDGRWVAGVVAAATTYFVVNNVLVGLVIAVATGSPARSVVWANLTQELVSDTVLLAFAPVVVVVAERGLLLLPLLLLPVYTVYRTARLSAEKEHQARHDTLTGLPNRANFDHVLRRRIARHEAGGPRAAVMLIDLDRFKEVNDTLGHQAGDDLLRQIGPRLSSVVRRGAVLARLGGDEFAVLVPDVGDGTDAQALALSILDAVQVPFPVEGFDLEVQASIGVALYPDHGDAADELMKRADIAMYVAKRLQTGAEVYDAGHDTHSTRRLQLVSELRRAISDGQIVLHYQPKLDLASGEVRSVEALVRWEHPHHGLVEPAEFVPVAEHTGLIRPLTSHVLATAARQAAVWRASGLPVEVAVNLSARNLHDGGIITDVAVNLHDHGLPAGSLRLEITESSIMMDPVRARRSLQTLHDMGVGLSIDDFGTGYSSLAYLQNLPVDEIKIDRSFVTRLLHNHADQAIVQSTIDLARNLGLTSTAEGVESCEAQEWLRRAGCIQAQGHHIAEPMPVAAVTHWLRTRAGVHAGRAAG